MRAVVTAAARRCTTATVMRAHAPLATRAAGSAVASFVHAQSFHAHTKMEQQLPSSTPPIAVTNARSSLNVKTPASTETLPTAETNTSAEEPERVILRNALNHVPQHGWSIEALAAGATDMGYPSVAHGMFPRGAIELVDYFMDKCHDDMKEKLVAHTAELQSMRVTDRLKFGVRTRLELLTPMLTTWPQAMGLGAMPQNAPTTFTKLAKLSDEIWYFAGDQSTDASWYTKRALLTSIYASTELFLLSDQSPGYQDTWAFLDRRIDETIALGELPQNLGDAASMAGIALQSFVSAATSLAGPLGQQFVAQTPLANVPNPIAAVGANLPTSVVSGLASAGFTTGPTGATSSNSASGFAPSSPFERKFNANDLDDIDAELEKLGGANRR